MVAQVTRILEVTGLTISLISLIVSLFIFTYFRLQFWKDYIFDFMSCFQTSYSALKRSLQNHRTRIHKNLFAAIGIQVIIRLTLYMDQAVSTTAALTDVTSLAGSSVDQLQNNNGIHTTVSKLLCFSGRSWYEQKQMFTLLFPVGSPFYAKCFTSSSSTHAQPCLFGCSLKGSSFTTSLQVYFFYFLKKY